MGTLYFSANDGTNGYELWRSDGTDAGTVRVKDIQVGRDGSSPQRLTNLNGTLYFVADDGTHGFELWSSNGTEGGTVLLEDIAMDDGDSAPRSLVNVAGQLYFSAISRESGHELWIARNPPDGDFNDDGLLNCEDINALSAAIVAGGNLSPFDLNGDGVVNTIDRDAWLAEAGSHNLGSGRQYLLGDANLDGVVDGSDFSIWNTHKFSLTSAWCSGDFTADGVVDGSDFGVWNSHKFQRSDRDGTGITWVDSRIRGVLRRRVKPIVVQMTPTSHNMTIRHATKQESLSL
jgi:ELWxxDGT repeat protein